MRQRSQLLQFSDLSRTPSSLWLVIAVAAMIAPFVLVGYYGTYYLSSLPQRVMYLDGTCAYALVLENEIWTPKDCGVLKGQKWTNGGMVPYPVIQRQ